MIKCVIIEDEPKAQNVLSRYIDKTNSIKLIGSCKDGLEAMDKLPKLQPDLIFLDVNMPNLNGMELLKLLSNPPKVIITTAYSEYALESYDYEVLDYLLKPISFEKFLRAIQRFNEPGLPIVESESEIKYDSKYTLIKSGSRLHKIKLDDILFLKKDGNYLEVITCNSKMILIRSNMSDVFNLIPQAEFLRVHKSYVVALNKIEVVEVNKLMIKNYTIPVGAVFRAHLNEVLKGNSF